MAIAYYRVIDITYIIGLLTLTLSLFSYLFFKFLGNVNGKILQQVSELLEVKKTLKKKSKKERANIKSKKLLRRRPQKQKKIFWRI